MKQFTANRLAGGNRLFPAEIHIDDFGVTLKVPNLFSGKEQSLGYDKISSIKIDSPLVGFSKITFHTVGWAWDSIVAEGFEKADAEEVKRLVQIGIQSVRHGSSGGSGAGPSVDMSHVIAQSEAAKAQAEVEKRKLDLEEAKHRQEVEEKDAARRKARADEYRKQGKNTLAFFVEMNPVYLIAIIVVVICLGVMGYKKYEQHAAHAEMMAEFSKFDNQTNNANTQPTTPNSQPVAAPSVPVTEKKVDTVKENQVSQQPPTIEPQPATAQQPQQQSTPNNNSAMVTADKAYFFDAADLNTKRKGYLVKGQKVAIAEEKGDFVSVTYTAENGMRTDAWMLKAELQKE